MAAGIILSQFSLLRNCLRFNLAILCTIFFAQVISQISCDLQRSKTKRNEVSSPRVNQTSSQFPECTKIVSFCKQTLRKLDQLGCNTFNSQNTTNESETNQPQYCFLKEDNVIQQTNRLQQMFEEKIHALEQEIEKLKSFQNPQKISSQPTFPPDVDLNQSLNTTIQSCSNLILLNKIPAAIRQWKIIEDHFLTHNSFHQSYNCLSEIIKRSYNHERSQIRQTLLFIQKLERPAQKSFAIKSILADMKSNGHFPGKEIFNVGYSAGRNFDGDHEIWLNFPKPVKLISTLWRLKWFVKYENITYAIKFADYVNSPLEILTVAKNPSSNRNDNNNYSQSENNEEIEWHFVSTAKWHWLKLIGGKGYVKVDEYSQILVKDSQERSPGEFELHLNPNLESFSMQWEQATVLSQMLFGKPFAFVVQRRRSLKAAEFIVAEPRDVRASRIIDLFD